MELDNDKLAQLFSESLSAQPDSFNERLAFNSQSRSDEARALEELISSLSDMDKRLKAESEERKLEDESNRKYTEKIDKRTFLLSAVSIVISIIVLAISALSLYVSVLQIPDDSDNAASSSYATEEYRDSRQSQG